ncbi:hypothetical protein [Enterobacter sp. ZOR0014]|uniref:hypothetical protein n=1 Tax=Enterobacter sp. ZOR0014 TaxID=1339232 RepID=UPI000647A6A2|nr:hypothetical protein [Enterobacter sp. ZOR0014]
MSELKIDNPAQRLLDLISEGKNFNSTDYSREVWKKLLDIPDADEQVLMARLAGVMALPVRISQVISDHFPDPRWNPTHWRTQVEKAFFSQELNGIWSKFYTHIDSQTLSELGMLSMLFEQRGEHAAIALEEIDTFLGRIIELREEIRQSGLSPAMKTMLLRQLFLIQEALESYSISGIEPVMDAVQSTLGLAVIDAEYREEISKGTGSQFGDKISSLLGDVANVVTVAGALPSLSAAIHTALTYLSK